MLKLIQDSREQLPLEFRPGIFDEIVVKGMPVGDYWCEIDGNEVPVQYDNAKGITQLQLPAGRHTVIGIFSETKLRLLADIISLTSFFSLIAIYKLKYYEKN